ncbi:hypothetical protein BHO_0119600 (plasmid) [Borrelia hermsii YBT]|uniref:Uncharacterized protein n=1 Tax=Borrelia hermsii YBT TaxID=1313295 RepID=W5T2B2_BORHE|nr:hypothetical protein [Borrelia hermsii]AHH13425.1 hypothetical protein BHO_0119600 [Borrelia hermsii YBT]
MVRVSMVLLSVLIINCYQDTEESKVKPEKIIISNKLEGKGIKIPIVPLVVIDREIPIPLVNEIQEGEKPGEQDVAGLLSPLPAEVKSEENALTPVLQKCVSVVYRDWVSNLIGLDEYGEGSDFKQYLEKNVPNTKEEAINQFDGIYKDVFNYKQNYYHTHDLYFENLKWHPYRPGFIDDIHPYVTFAEVLDVNLMQANEMDGEYIYMAFIYNRDVIYSLLFGVNKLRSKCSSLYCEVEVVHKYNNTVVKFLKIINDMMKDVGAVFGKQLYSNYYFPGDIEYTLKKFVKSNSRKEFDSKVTMEELIDMNKRLAKYLAMLNAVSNVLYNAIRCVALNKNSTKEDIYYMLNKIVNDEHVIRVSNIVKQRGIELKESYLKIFAK